MPTFDVEIQIADLSADSSRIVKIPVTADSAEEAADLAGALRFTREEDLPPGSQVIRGAG